jgi:hypothetical protein
MTCWHRHLNRRRERHQPPLDPASRESRYGQADHKPDLGGRRRLAFFFRSSDPAIIGRLPQAGQSRQAPLTGCLPWLGLGVRKQPFLLQN